MLRRIALCLALVGCVPATNQEPIDYVALSEAVQQSQDYSLHGQMFEGAARQLVDSGRCSVGDLAAIGGFIRASLDFPDEPVYFTYCRLSSGGAASEKQVLLNVRTGEIT